MATRTCRYAPIVVFAYNRPDLLERCLEHILKNDEARESDLYIFVDGPKAGGKDSNKIEQTRQIAQNICGFKSVNCHFSEKNKGLASSIISGVSQIIKEYGQAIVIEDDLLLTENALAYLNSGLQAYKDEKKVFSICAYTNLIDIPSGYKFDTYFATRSSSWGWATWQDRWESVDWELKDFESLKKNKSGFNRWGGSDCWGMLNKWHEGKVSSWAIRFCFSQYLQDKLSVFPIKSLVDNEGFDGNGSNCKKWSRFKFELDKSSKKEFKFNPTVETNSSILRQARQYHSIRLRLFSKIMYFIYR